VKLPDIYFICGVTVFILLAVIIIVVIVGIIGFFAQSFIEALP